MADKTNQSTNLLNSVPILPIKIVLVSLLAITNSLWISCVTLSYLPLSTKELFFYLLKPSGHILASNLISVVGK